MKKILIIIPAYNEAENIEKVVKSLVNNCNRYIDYVIVNDGSKDNTSDICRKNGYNYIDLPVNLGLAGAFQTGMKYAYYNGYDYAIQFDGDGQHNAEYILPMMEYAEKNNLNIVIGSRFIKAKKSLGMRMIGNSIIEMCIRITTGTKIHDSTSGMRMFDKSVINILANEDNLGPEPDTVAFLIRSGIKVGEYQVHMNEREAGESYLNFSNSIKYMFHMCTSILIVQWFRKRVKLCQSI